MPVMPTYVPIATYTAVAGDSTITFNNILQGYTDLVLVATSIGSATYTGTGFWLRYNNDSSSLYSYLISRGYGSGQDSYRGGTSSFGTFESTLFSNGVPSTVISHINNYSNPNIHKTSVSKAYGNYIHNVVNVWRSTAPITRIDLITVGGSSSQAAGGVYTLYGITAAPTSVPTTVKASGGDITNDGNYWYHTFRTSGIFTPNSSLTCDILAAGGGGGGGSGIAGGGGAGTLLWSTGATVSSATTITIGAGGAGGTGDQNGTAGGQTLFGAVFTAPGGGYGGGYQKNGGTGGSGGGAGVPASGTFSGGSVGNGAGTFTSGYVYAGGGSTYNATGATYNLGGGGGGAGGPGITSGNNIIPNGGYGLMGYAPMLHATGVGVNGYLAGGGGGGAWISATTSPGLGGWGGGGNGAKAATPGTSGKISTGSGGGGGSSGDATYPSGYAGGSGVLIVRYTV